MYKSVTKAVILYLYAISFICKADQPINLYKERAVSLDGKMDKFVVSISVRSLSMSSPFLWDVVIKNESKVLFKESRDDSELDVNFESSEYVGNCNGWLECKQKWYLDELPKHVLKALTYVEGEAPQDWQLSSLRINATKFLKESGYSKSEITEILKEMKINLKTGFISFSIPISPVEQDSIFMYVKTINLFVPYWND